MSGHFPGVTRRRSEFRKVEVESRDGSAGTRELLYRTDDHRLMSLSYSVNDGAFIAGKPREWTSVRLADTGVINNFDVHPDGSRVLALLPADRDDDRRTRNNVTIVLNFVEEIRRRVSRVGK